MVSGLHQFRKTNRLSKPAEYKVLFVDGQRHHALSFIFLSKRNELNEARLGLAISKKHVPLATQRNGLKRIIRESFRENKKALIGWDVVVVTKRKADMVNIQQLPHQLKRYWNSVGQ